MTVERHFLGWDAPVTARVREFLLPSQISGPVDLGRELIVVPTRQASRRLREALALHCAEQKTALLASRIVTPSSFLRPRDNSTETASQTEVAAAWADILIRANTSEYRGLFPTLTPRQDFPWALHMGESIQRLRDALADGGYRIADVYRSFCSVMEEPERWNDLARLENAYLDRLHNLGRQDPCDSMIKAAQQPELARGVERIVVAVVPDPTPLLIQALERLAEQTCIVILVHAPETMANHFDNWGRPVAQKWQEAKIAISDPEVNIILADSPSSQSRKVLEVIAREAGHFGPTDIAIGVPDSEVASFLETDLSDKKLRTFNPAGNTLKEHPLYHFLETFRTLITESSYVALSAFLHHVDVIHCIQNNYNVSPRWLLEELDKFQNRYLPLRWENIYSLFSQESSDGRDTSQKFVNLKKAVVFTRQQEEVFESNDLDTAVRSLLQTLYQSKIINPGNPDDDEFIAVAKLVDAALREFGSECINTLGIDKKRALELLLWRLGRQSYYPEHDDTVIDLEGWLELPWNDAPFLIVTGINDGNVPDSQLSDVFLPDSLRSQLNLRHDADQFARDVYLMCELLESRKQEGCTYFIVGKTSIAGDPLKPSRLLFRCDDEELLRRTDRLFGAPKGERESSPSTISFMLDARPPADVPANQLTLTKLPVTWFKDYLACPFRFYLRHILGMEKLDDEKREMDAPDFGSLVHYALQKMAESTEMRQCEKDHELSKFLCTEAANWVARRFGSSVPLQVAIQLEAARERLKAAAHVQAELVREGWDIVQSEMNIEAEFNGIKVSGRIDRIDRHRETGHIRVLDYKTSDKATNPSEAHLSSSSTNTQAYAKVILNGKNKRWTNLQLPLYIIVLSKEESYGQIETSYFNLPKAVKDTRVTLWNNFSSELLESARTCVEGVINDIHCHRFWPPAANVPYDDFESLFPADAIDCVAFEL